MLLLPLGRYYTPLRVLEEAAQSAKQQLGMMGTGENAPLRQCSSMHGPARCIVHAPRPHSLLRSLAIHDREVLQEAATGQRINRRLLIRLSGGYGGAHAGSREGHARAGL